MGLEDLGTSVALTSAGQRDVIARGEDMDE